MDYLSTTVKLVCSNNAQSSAAEKLDYIKPELKIFKVENIVTSGISALHESGCATTNFAS